MRERDSGPNARIEPTPCPICEEPLQQDEEGDLVCASCKAYWDPDDGSFGGWSSHQDQCTSQVYERVYVPDGEAQASKSVPPGTPTVRCVRARGHEVTRFLGHVGVSSSRSKYCWPNSWLVDAPEANDDPLQPCPKCSGRLTPDGVPCSRCAPAETTPGNVDFPGTHTLTSTNAHDQH